MFRAGAVPGAPGARRGPQGTENLPKTRGRIYNFILAQSTELWTLVWLQAAAGSATLGTALLRDTDDHDDIVRFVRLDDRQPQSVPGWSASWAEWGWGRGRSGRRQPPTDLAPYVTQLSSNHTQK